MRTKDQARKPLSVGGNEDWLLPLGSNLSNPSSEVAELDSRCMQQRLMTNWSKCCVPLRKRRLCYEKKVPKKTHVGTYSHAPRISSIINLWLLTPRLLSRHDTQRKESQQQEKQWRSRWGVRGGRKPVKVMLLHLATHPYDCKMTCWMRLDDVGPEVHTFGLISSQHKLTWLGFPNRA